MKLETLRMKGVLRFKDEVSLDFRDLPPGLVAFVGPYGEGKTTTLEGPLAGLLREFPSRKAFDLLDVVHGTDSFIESTFELEGQGLFRARLNLDGPHRKAEGIFAHIGPDGQQHILNDGKVSTYDQMVAQHLPPKALLLASVFAAQDKSGSFSTLDRKGRRELFASLLGLEHYQLVAVRAKTAAGLVQQSLATVSAIRDVLERDAGETVERSLEWQSQQLQTDGGAVELRRVELQRDLFVIEAELESLQQAATAYAMAKAHAGRLDVDLAATTRESDACIDALKRHDEDAEAQRFAYRTATTGALASLGKQQEDTSAHAREVAAIATRLQKALADIAERIANNRMLLDEGPAIRAAVEAIGRVNAAITAIRDEQLTDAKKVETLRRRERVLSESLAAIGLAEAELLAATGDTAILQSVPCDGVGVFATCQFLWNAANAKARIPALTEVVGSKPVADTELRDVRSQLATIGTRALELQTRITTLERERGTHEAAGKRLANLELAEDRIAGLEGQQADAQTDNKELTAAAQVREAARVRDLQQRRTARDAEGVAQLNALEDSILSRKGELVATAGRLTQRLDVLLTERMGLEDLLALHAHASESAAAQRALLTLRQREWDTSTADLARVTSQRDDLDQRRQELAEKRDALQAAETRLAQLHTDLIEWSLLSKALGRDGLQTLEIDDAGPTVSKYANDLLESSGLPFQLDLVTQEPKASKGKDGSTHKDVFEVKVIHLRDGGEPRDLGLLSGGERVIVEEALRSAIALLVNARNVHPMRTCWRDETIGSLDAETATRYVSMLRRVVQIGGFHHLFFISHNADAAMLADSQVVFADGHASMRYPPYGRIEAAA